MTETVPPTISILLDDDDEPNFPVVAAPPLPLPTLQVSKMDAGMASLVAQPAAARQLSCVELISQDPAKLQLARQTAAQVYHDMYDPQRKLVNSAVVSAYGTTALAPLNALADRLLHDTRNVKVAEIETLTKELSRGMKGLKNKYDVSQPDIRAKYEKMAAGQRHFWQKVPDLFNMIKIDIQSVEARLNAAQTDLVKRQIELIRHVAIYDEIYAANRAEVKNLILVIAVMELVAEQAARDADAIIATDSDADEDKREDKRNLAELASLLQVKVAEFKGRLFVGWSTSPQVRNMRSLDIAMAGRLNMLACSTVPTAKLTISRWRLMIETLEAARAGQAMADFSNEVQQDFAAAGPALMREIARVVQAPTLTCETIALMADCVAKEADEVLDAFRQGVIWRQEQAEAIESGRQTILNSDRKYSSEIVDAVLGRATQPPPALALGAAQQYLALTAGPSGKSL